MADATDACDQTGSRYRFAVQFKTGQRAELQKWTVRIQQSLDAFANEQFVARQVFVPCCQVTALPGALTVRLEGMDLSLHVLAVFAKSRVQWVDLSLDHLHGG